MQNGKIKVLKLQFIQSIRGLKLKNSPLETVPTNNNSEAAPKVTTELPFVCDKLYLFKADQVTSHG